QRRDEVGDRTSDRLVDVELRGAVFFLFQILNAYDETRDAVGLVDGQDLLGELDRLIDVAVGNRGDEGAIEQFAVLGIGAQRGAIERGGGGRIALDAGVAGGKIAAGRGQRLQIVARGKLRRAVLGPLGRLRKDRKGQRGGQRQGSNGPASATNGKHHGSLWLFEEFTDRLECDFRPARRIKAADNAVFGAQSQGFA